MNLVSVYEKAIADSEDLLDFKGRTLEDANKEQPVLMARYARLHVEARNVTRLLDSRADAIRARLHKSIKKTSDITLADRTIDKYVDGDQEMLDHLALMVEIRSLEEQLAAVVEAIRMRGFALNNITKARVESVHLAVL